MSRSFNGSNEYVRSARANEAANAFHPLPKTRCEINPAATDTWIYAWCVVCGVWRYVESVRIYLHIPEQADGGRDDGYRIALHVELRAIRNS